MQEISIMTRTFLLALALLLTALPVWAARLTDKDVETLVRAEKTWTNRSNLTVKVTQNEVMIGAYREPGAADKDMKIDSVMITRKIMEADPEVVRVQVRFYDPNNRTNYELVNVRQSDIKAFSQGLIDNETLLSGIDIQKVSLQSDVIEGDYATERLAAKRQIDKLRSEGVGVAPFMQLFGQAEEYAKEHNKTELRATLDKLNQAFDSHAAFMKKQRDRALAKQMEAENQTRAAQQAQVAAAAQRGKAVQATANAWVPPPADIDPKTGIERFGMQPPFPGVYLLDRIYIARQINQLRKNNSPVSHLMPIWRRMESEVLSKNEVAVRNDVEYLQKQLGLPALTDEQRQAATVVKVQRF
jgi:hypothetical protein